MFWVDSDGFRYYDYIKGVYTLAPFCYFRAIGMSRVFGDLSVASRVFVPSHYWDGFSYREVTDKGYYSDLLTEISTFTDVHVSEYGFNFDVGSLFYWLDRFGFTYDTGCTVPLIPVRDSLRKVSLAEDLIIAFSEGVIRGCTQTGCVVSSPSIPVEDWYSGVYRDLVLSAVSWIYPEDFALAEGILFRKKLISALSGIPHELVVSPDGRAFTVYVEDLANEEFTSLCALVETLQSEIPKGLSLFVRNTFNSSCTVVAGLSSLDRDLYTVVARPPTIMFSEHNYLLTGGVMDRSGFSRSGASFAEHSYPLTGGVMDRSGFSRSGASFAEHSYPLTGGVMDRSGFSRSGADFTERVIPLLGGVMSYTPEE